MASEIVMPKLGMVMADGVVARWLKAEGQAVEQGDVIAEIETEKLNYDLEATGDGVLHPVAVEGDTVVVGGLIGYLLGAGESPPTHREAPATPAAASGPAAPPRPAPAPSHEPGTPVPSTPGARRLAAELGIDLKAVPPGGPRGRVIESDVRAFTERQPQAPAPPAAPSPQPTPAPETAPAPERPQTGAGPARVEPMRGIRKAIAGHMRRSISTTAQLTFMLDIDVTGVQIMRREASRDGDVPIGLPHVLMKACAETLKRYPSVNTVLSEDGVLFFDEVNLGIAVALENGLIVPVLRDVGSMGLAGIAAAAGDLADRARTGKLNADELAGGTFTISVLGTVDGFTPILNPGQNGILGIGRVAEKPVVVRGEIVVREMTTVSLTVDHQVIDGAVAAAFLRRFQQVVARPGRLFKA